MSLGWRYKSEFEERSIMGLELSILGIRKIKDEEIEVELSIKV